MCGIVGILGRAPVAEQLVDSLKRLEYRGYDSAGVATLEGGRLARRRAEGKLKNLEKRLDAEPLERHHRDRPHPLGHPRPSRPRTTRIRMRPIASPWFTTASSRISASCAKRSRKRATVFQTETDTEIVLHLVDQSAARRGVKPVEAVRARRCRNCAARSRSASSSPATTIC